MRSSTRRGWTPLAEPGLGAESNTAAGTATDRATATEIEGATEPGGATATPHRQQQDVTVTPGASHSWLEGDPSDDVVRVSGARRFRELIPAANCIVTGVAVLVLSQELSTGPGGSIGARFWPTLIAWSLIVLGAGLVVAAIRTRGKPGDAPDVATRTGVGRLVATLGILLGYLALWGILQFWLITFIASVALMALYGMRGWKPLLLFPAVVVAVIQLLFITALRVPL